ncbi:hypothetical protein [Polaromonas aquatica]|uniref:Uncharacterized protein n=1 Tax=Polaromonas aquatica TaxID=332657 RepID=A0ABW1TR28_9BURK
MAIQLHLDEIVDDRKDSLSISNKWQLPKQVGICSGEYAIADAGMDRLVNGGHRME